MKKLLFAAALGLFAFAAEAQTGYNYTACPVTVQLACINTSPCTKTAGPIITLPPSGAPIALPFPACPPGDEVAYNVCWVNCPGVCTWVTVTPPPTICAPWPSVVPLAPCAPCPAATVSVNALGDVKVF